MTKITHSVQFAKHRTSVRMEARIWGALEEIAATRRQTISQLLADIERWRVAEEPTLSRSAALRVYAVEYYRTSLREARVVATWLGNEQPRPRVE